MSQRNRHLALITLSLATTLGACNRDAAVAPTPAAVKVLETPAATDSMSPRLSSGADNTIVLSWLEPDGDGHALRFAELKADGWSAPQTVASGAPWFVNYADIPSVVPISDKLWGAHWLASRNEFGEAYDIDVVISTDRGSTWSRPVVPHHDDTDTQHGFVSMYPSGDGVGLVWLDGRKYVNEVTDDVAASAMTLRGATVHPDLTVTDDALIDDVICDCCQTDVAQSSAGMVVAYRNRTVDEIRDIYLAQNVNGTWLPGRPVHDDHWLIDGCPVNGPVVEAAGGRVAVAWFTGAGGKARVEAAWSKDAGESFGPPVDIGVERPLGHVGAQMLPNGDLIVSWLRAGDEHSTELCLRRVSSDGGLGETHVLTEAPDVFAFSVPQLALRGDELIVAWTSETDDDHTSVGSATVPLALL